MSDESYVTDGKGKWYRKVEIDGEIKRLRLDSSTEQYLQTRYGDRVGNEPSNVSIGTVPKEQFRRDVEQVLTEIAQDKYNENLRIEDASRKDLREQRGGGVIMLRKQDMEHGNYGNSNDPNKYESFMNELDELRKREDKGDKEAKRKIDGIYKIMGRDIMKMAGDNVNIIQCPRCGRGIDTLQSDTCPYCNLDLNETGWSKYGETRGGTK